MRRCSGSSPATGRADAKARIRRAQGRSRLRPAAQEVHGQRRRRHTGADQAAVNDTIPNVAPMFWSFRIMVGLGMLVPVHLRRGVLSSSRAAVSRRNRWLMRLAAVEHSAAMDCDRSSAGSSPSTAASRGRSAACCPRIFRCRPSRSGQVLFSLGGFIVFYTALLVVEMYLMLKYIRLGPRRASAPGAMRATTRRRAARS